MFQASALRQGEYHPSCSFTQKWVTPIQQSAQSLLYIKKPCSKPYPVAPYEEEFNPSPFPRPGKIFFNMPCVVIPNPQ